MRLSCNVVRDLVGVCTDGAASGETRRAVTQHLATCPACARYYYDYARIGRRYRARRAHVASGTEDGYRALSVRLKKKRQTDMAATAAALLATAAVTALALGTLNTAVDHTGAKREK